jgi:hypothetical protein
LLEIAFTWGARERHRGDSHESGEARRAAGTLKQVLPSSLPTETTETSVDWRLDYGRELIADILENRIHLRARECHRGDSHESDERDEQCVLEQVLPFVVATEPTQTIDDEIHDVLRAPR